MVAQIYIFCKTLYCEAMTKQKKLPPYGAALVDRQKWRNLPFLVLVCVGANAWQRAKKWQNSAANQALVLPDGLQPNSFKWPVCGCLCVIEWDTGPSSQIIMELIELLLRSGARSVTVYPKFADMKTSAWFYDAEKEPGRRWTQQREVLRTHLNYGAVSNVA